MRNLPFPLRALSLGVIAASLCATAALADEKAEKFISGVLDEANAAFEKTDRSERDAAIEALVDKYVDWNRVARFTLGQYARQASAEQIAEFKPLYHTYATSVYQGMLEDYTGEKLKVTGSTDRSPRDIIVDSKVVGAKPGDQYADLVVHWRVYRTPEGEQTVIDAGAQGVWLAIEQQSQFKSIIANNGGGEKGIDALIADLKTKTGQ